MSRPLKKQSVSGATSTTKGSEHFVKAHTKLGLYVVADNLDTANDTLTVRLEAGLDTDNSDGTIDQWAEIVDEAGNKAEVTASDFSDPDGDGNFAVFFVMDDIPAEIVRANVSSFTDSSGGDLSVDAHIYTGGNADGAGHRHEG